MWGGRRGLRLQSVGDMKIRQHADDDDRGNPLANSNPGPQDYAFVVFEGSSTRFPDM